MSKTTKWVRAKIPEEDRKFLVRRWGSAAKGVREVVKEARARYMEPSTPTLREAWRVLVSHAEAAGFMRWMHLREALIKELGFTPEKVDKVAGELCREGFLRTIDTGVVQIRQPGEVEWKSGEEELLRQLGVVFK